MICRAAAPGLPRCDQHPVAPAPAANERPGQRHRDPCPAAPTARTATPGRQANVHRHRPRCPRRPAPSPLEREAAPAPAAGTPGHNHAVAPQPAQATTRSHLRAEAARTPTHGPLHPRPGPAPGSREFLVGLSPDPRRARGAGHQGRRLHRLGDPPRARHPTRARTAEHDLGPLPAQPGRRAARLRLLRDPHPDRGASVRLRRHRATPPGASGSSAPPRTPPRTGSCNSDAISSWTWRTRAARPDS